MKALLLNLSTKGALFIGVILALVYQFTFFDNGDSIKEEIKNLRAQREEKMKETEKLKKENQILSEVERNKKILGSQFKTLISYIPEDDTASSYIKLLTSQAKLSNVDIVNLERREEVLSKEGLYTILNFNIELKSTYSNVLLFLSYLTKVKRIINIEDFNLSTVKEKDAKQKNVIFRGKIVTYRYNKKSEKPKEGKK